GHAGSALAAVRPGAQEAAAGGAVAADQRGRAAVEADQRVVEARPVGEGIVPVGVDRLDPAAAEEAGQVDDVDDVVPEGRHAVLRGAGGNQVLVELDDAERDRAAGEEAAARLRDDRGVAALEADHALAVGGSGGPDQRLDLGDRGAGRLLEHDVGAGGQAALGDRADEGRTHYRVDELGLDLGQHAVEVVVAPLGRQVEVVGAAGQPGRVDLAD